MGLLKLASLHANEFVVLGATHSASSTAKHDISHAGLGVTDLDELQCWQFKVNSQLHNISELALPI